MTLTTDNIAVKEKDPKSLSRKDIRMFIKRRTPIDEILAVYHLTLDEFRKRVKMLYSRRSQLEKIRIELKRSCFHDSAKKKQVSTNLIPVETSEPQEEEISVTIFNPNSTELKAEEESLSAETIALEKLHSNLCRAIREETRKLLPVQQEIAKLKQELQLHLTTVQRVVSAINNLTSEKENVNIDLHQKRTELANIRQQLSETPITIWVYNSNIEVECDHSIPKDVICPETETLQVLVAKFITSKEFDELPLKLIRVLIRFKIIYDFLEQHSDKTIQVVFENSILQSYFDKF